MSPNGTIDSGTWGPINWSTHIPPANSSFAEILRARKEPNQELSLPLDTSWAHMPFWQRDSVKTTVAEAFGLRMIDLADPPPKREFFSDSKGNIMTVKVCRRIEDLL